MPFFKHPSIFIPYIKNRLLIIFFFVASITVSAQQNHTLVWWNPVTTPEIHPGGQGWFNESNNFFSRLPDDASKKVTEEVFDLAQNSAGISLQFNTDAPTITVEYSVTEQLQFAHMPATWVSGIDLFNISGKRIVGTYQFGDTIRYIFSATAMP